MLGAQALSAVGAPAPVPHAHGCRLRLSVRRAFGLAKAAACELCERAVLKCRHNLLVRLLCQLLRRPRLHYRQLTLCPAP